jgi:hypothetical protein
LKNNNAEEEKQQQQRRGEGSQVSLEIAVGSRTSVKLIHCHACEKVFESEKEYLSHRYNKE